MIVINVFFLVLSVIFLLKFIFEFIIKLKDEDPTPMSINKTDQWLLLLTISYIITNIII
jgi:hypothetical protein